MLRPPCGSREYLGGNEWVTTRPQMFPSRLTSYDFYASRVASFDHIRILGSRAALGCDIVCDGLVIGPPLIALHVFLCWAH
jgi:hypothetical protein